MKTTLVAALAACCLTGIAAAQDAARLFDYDAGLPLDIRDSLVAARDRIRIYDVSYASPRGGRVTATLVAPASGRRHPAILFGHWGYGDRFEFLPEAELWARAGVVSLLVDYPWVRPAPWRRDQAPGVSDPELDRDLFVQAVIDLRRGLDLLAGRPEVDTARLAYVGHSYGAQWGAILAAVDDRVRTAALVAGVGSIADQLDHDDPAWVAFRARNAPAQLQRYKDVVGVLDAIRWVGRAGPTPLLFQFAERERGYSRASMERYAAAAGPQAVVQWYPAGHEINDLRALADRAAFLRATGRLPDLSEQLRRSLKVRPRVLVLPMRF